jgi:hypothetical protein
MYPKSKKIFIIYFFTVAFFLLKVVNLHAFEHIAEQDFDDNHCELCEFFITNSENNPVTFPPEAPEISIPVLFVPEPVQVNYNAPQIAIPYSGYFFNKPPPTL